MESDDDIFGFVTTPVEQINPFPDLDISLLTLKHKRAIKEGDSRVLSWTNLKPQTQQYLRDSKDSNLWEKIMRYLQRHDYLPYDFEEFKTNDLELKTHEFKKRYKNRVNTYKGVRRVRKGKHKSKTAADKKALTHRYDEKGYTPPPSGIINTPKPQTKKEQRQWKEEQAEKRLNRIVQRRESLVDKGDLSIHRQVMRAKKLSLRQQRRERRALKKGKNNNLSTESGVYTLDSEQDYNSSLERDLCSLDLKNVDSFETIYRFNEFSLSTEATFFRNHFPELEKLHLYFNTYICDSQMAGSFFLGHLCSGILKDVFEYTVLFYQLMRCRNKWDLMAQLYVSCRFIGMKELLTKNPISEMIVNFYERLQMIRSTQAGDFLASWEGFLSSVHDSKLYDSLRNIILKIFSISIFKNDYTDKFVKLLVKTKKSSVVSFVALILGDLSTIYKFFEAWRETGNFSDALFLSDPVEKVIQDCNDLYGYSELLYTGLPSPGRKCQYEYMAESQKLIDTIDYLLKSMNNYTASYKRLKQQRLRISSKLNELRSLTNSKERPFPMGIIVSGDPGIGKSSIITYICAEWSNVKGRPFSKDQVYTRIPDSPYWECHNPDAQKYIKYTEVANLNSKIVARSGDPIISEINSLMDTEPYPLNTAFESKGKVFANPEIVIMDTNTENLNAKESVNNPAAILRRFLVVRCVVKDEYKKPSPLCGLDPEKALKNGRMDMWHFEIVWKHPRNNTEYDEEVIRCNSEEEVSRVLRSIFIAHIERQEKYMERTKDLMDRVSKKEDIESLSTESYISPLVNKFIPICTDAYDMTRKICTSTYNMTHYALLLFLFWYTQGVAASSNIFHFRWYMFALFISAYIKLGCYSSFTMIILFLLLLLSSLDLHIVLHLVEMKNKATRRDINHKFLREFENIKHLIFGYPYVPFLVAAGSMYAIFRAVKFIFDTIDLADISMQSHTTFKESSEYDGELNQFEEEVSCRPSVTRVKSKLHNTWNVRIQDNLPNFTGKLEDMPKCFSNNVRKCRIPIKSVESHLLGLKGSIALINTHTLKGLEEFEIQICTSDTWRNGSAPYVTFITKSRRMDLSNDLTLLNLSSIRFRNILQHISEKPISGMLSSKAIFRGTSLKVHYYNETIKIKDGFKDVVLSGIYRYNYPAHTTGICGSPLYVQSGNGAVIAGIHVAGNDFNTHGSSTPLIKSVLEEGVSSLEISSGLHSISSQSNLSLETVEPISKSSVHFVKLGGLDYLGKLKGNVLIKGRSKLIPTPFSREISDVFHDVYNFVPDVLYGPPIMAPQWKDGEYLNPYNLALEKYSLVKPGLHHELLIRIIHEFKNFIMENLKSYELSPLTLEETINGSESDQFLRRINASTSAGFGCEGIKSEYLPDVSDLKDCSLRELLFSERPKLLEYIKRMENGESLNFVNNLQLKDEPRELSKIKSGKTRPFCVSQLHAVILARMFLSPLYMLMVENNFAFCTSVGINMHSQSHYIVDTLTEFSELIMEGDYSNYDQSIPFDIGWATNTLVRSILEDFGYNEKALKCVDVLLTENLFSYVNINKDLFLVPGLQPSGKYATAEDNSLRGVILMMYAWYSTGQQPGTFFENVRPITYGDDVLAAVKPEAKHIFNNNFYQKACKDHFNMKYTSASKSSTMDDFLSIYEVSFLKRTFQQRDNQWIAPLDMNSIFKSLVWYIPSKHVSSDKQLIDTMNSALWELYFHSTEASFNIIRSHFVLLAESYLDFAQEEIKRVLVSYGYIYASLNNEDIELPYPELGESLNIATIKLL